MERTSGSWQTAEDHFQNVLLEKHSVTSRAPVSHVQLACSPCFCAFPLHGNELCIMKTNDPSLQSVQLKGHHHTVTAVTFGNRQEPVLVCSASEDYIIVWEAERCHKQAMQGMIPRGIVIGTLLGNVQYLSMSPDDGTVAACTDAKIYMLNSKYEEVFTILEGHLGSVTAAEFCSWQPDILVSVSEDRTFKVWNQINGEVLYQSAVLSASPLLSLCLSEEHKQLITGSGDGQVWVFSLLDGQQYRLVIQVDLQKTEQRYLRNMELKQKQLSKSASPNKNTLEGEERMETTMPVLRITPCKHFPLLNEKAKSFSSMNSFNFWIGSSDSLHIINLATSEIEAALQFKDYAGLSIAVAGSCAIQHGTTNNVFCLLTSMFENHIALLEVNLTALARACHHFNGQACCLTETLCVVARIPLLPTSPLNFELVKREDSKPACQKKSDVKSSVKDQPLVFHTKVKSSGYTATPRMTMFSLKTNIQKPRVQPTKGRNNRGCVIIKDYPVDSPAPSVVQTQVSTAVRPTPVCSLQYSGDGKQLACGLGDKSILLYNSSLTGSPAVYTGHDGAVTSIGWSHNRNWLLSASEDKTLKIWPAQGTEPALELGDDTFSKPIRSAQFYYMDKFILMSSGPSLQLFAYHLDTSRDDIKRYKQRSVCKLVGKFQMTPSTEVTCLSAVNEFYSHIVLASGSNRMVEVFDFNVGCSVAAIPDAHCRAVHQIVQNKGSVFSTQGSDAYNLFLTTAVTDGIKLWDLRTVRCVRRYEGHLNRCHPCGIAITPCGQFIATGSENKCLRIWLSYIRSSSFIHKLSRHTDTVINVAFNPLSPKLVTATLDGKLQLFKP
ncbi:WD repeat-containing protein 27 [Polyodon spathula]|uniref:WD repeat-containing protein 27 n=1 Tax=Polyodon spathula TaxID=7913 RepID=UPI001B7DAA0E|nr:WD repeat-containing protein 27 [Polyodon spathula]